MFKNEIKYTKDGKLVRLFNVKQGKWILEVHIALNQKEITTCSDDFTLITYFNNTPYGKIGSEIYASLNDTLYLDRTKEALAAILEVFPNLINFIQLQEYGCGTFLFSEEEIMLPTGIY